MIAGQAGDWTRMMYGVAAFVVVIILSSCGDDPAGGVTLSIMSYNVGNVDNPQPTTEQVADLIHKHGLPDVLFTQDTPWFLEIKDLAALTGLSYFVTGKTQVPISSLGILSRFPLRNLDVIYFQRTKYKQPAAMCVEARIAAKNLMLCSLQLRSPSDEIRQGGHGNKLKLKGLYGVLRNEFFRETPRSRSVGRFLDWLDTKHTDIVIVGGDFNSIQLSKPIRTMSAHLKDAFWPSLNYFRGTYTGLDFPFKPRLDFIFHSEGAVSIDTKVITQTAGDHFPIQATFNFPVDNPPPQTP